MTAHEHRFAIISHTEDRWKVLVSCQIMPCNKIEVWNQPKMKIKIEARKFRPMSKDDFKEQTRQLAHLCCQTTP